MAAALLAAACGGGGSSSVVTETAGSDTTSPTGSASGQAGTAPADSSPTGSASGESGTAPADSSPTGSVSETREAILILDRETLDGSRLDLDALAGREVMLWFWAPW